MAFNTEEFSGSESDTGFDEDMEALKRACLITGTKPYHHLHPSTSATSNSDGVASPAESVDVEEEEDDLELIRKMQRRFSGDGFEEPLNLKPIYSLPPVLDSDYDDDSDDDFQILRAIQRRFSDYNSDSLRKNTEDCLHKLQVGSININSGKETSNNLYTGSTNIGEGFPDCVDARTTRHVSDDATGNQPFGFLEWHELGAENVSSSPVRDYSGFPKSAQAFLDAIKKNRSCQKYLRSKLMQIEARIQGNSKLKENVKALKDFQVCCRRRTGRALSQKKDDLVQLISVPKLRANAKVKEKKNNAMYYGPAENSHVPNYRMILKKFPVSLSREKWTEEEDENIVKGIKQQFQDMLLQKTYQKEELLHQKSVDLVSDAEGLSGISNDFDSIIESIGDLDITNENMRVFLPKVNWEQLASMYVIGRSGAECEARWLNWKDPLINKESWTKLEEKNLLHIIQQKGISNWIDIAVSLGTNRTPFQCLAHYQRSLNPSILKREWTEDEDDKLRTAVETYGDCDWQLVAAALEGRTGTQCSNRWKKSLNPMRKKIGKWTPDEDKHLKVAVMIFGARNWGNIAQFVSGRTKEQCRERWKNCLDPSLKRGEWSEDEDSRLKAAIAEHGPRWSRVAACVPPRTDSQCLRRWMLLFPNEVPLCQAARKMRKIALISNFVDRESKRPALGPNDFVPLKMIVLPETEDTDYPRKRKSRSKRRRKEAQIRPEGASRLNDGSEVINFSGDDGISRKKRGRKVCLDDPAPDTVLLRITNGEEFGADGGDIAMKKKASGRRKNRCRRKSDDADATSRHVAVPMKKRTRRLRSGEDKGSDPTNQKVGDLGGDEATKNQKASKLPSRKDRCTDQRHEDQLNTFSDEVEASGGEDSISTKKNRKIRLRSKKNKCGPMHSHSSEFPNSSFPVVFGKRVEPVSRNDTSPYTSPERTENGAIVEAVEGDNNDAISPRCSTPDISDSWNSKIDSVGRQNKFIGTRSRRKTCSNQTPNTQIGDDSTLASFIKQSRKSRKSKSSSVTVSKLLDKCGNITKMSDGSQNIALQPRCSTSEIGLIEDSSASVVGANKGRKMLQIRSKLCSDQMSGAEDEYDMTLASYCSRLKN